MSERRRARRAWAAAQPEPELLERTSVSRPAPEGRGAWAAAQPEPELLEQPRRPYLPPLLFCLLGCIVAARLTLENGLVPPAGARVAAALGLACCTALLARERLRARSGSGEPRLWLRRAGCLVAGCTLGLLLASLSLAGQQRSQALVREAGVAASAWEVTGDPYATRGGWGCDVRACAGSYAGARARLSWNDERTPCPVRKGHILAVRGSFEAAQDDDWGRALRTRGVCGSLRATRVKLAGELQGPLGWLLAARARAAQRLGVFEPGPRALLGGCVLGLRQGLAADGTRELFARCGLAHLLAVSGAHLVVVTGVVARALARTRLPRRLRHLLLPCCTCAFVLASGMAASALRAWLMALVAQGADASGRRGHGLSSVALAALALVVADCGAVGDLGYLLSVTCVVALALYARYVGYVVEVLVTGGRTKLLLRGTRGIRIRKRLRALRDGAVASVVCQAASCPLTLPSFGTLSLVAPLASLLVTPPVTALVGMGVVVCALAALAEPPAWLLLPCDLLCAGTLWLVERLACLPWASVAVEVDPVAATLPVLAAAVLLFATWPRANGRLLRRVLACALALALAWGLRARFFAPARVCVLDVGQGDAILVQEGPHALLVDTGPPDGAVAAALTRQGVLHLDAVVITHQHDDHYGGLAALGSWRVGAVYVAQGVASQLVDELAQGLAACGSPPLHELACGDVLRVGGWSLRTLWPRAPVSGTTNPDSLIFSLTRGSGDASWRGLLTGDAERDELAALWDAGQLGRLDFLKVGHHGSAASLTQQQARALSPALAVASAGAGNRYGHPDPACVEALDAAGARFLCTKDVGDVTIRP